MQATIGDRICIHGNVVGHPDKNGEIVEVRGSRGEPPYMVKFDDGHTRLIFPGPDAVIEHPELTRAYQPSSPRRSSPMPKWCPTSWMTVRRTCSATSGSVRQIAQMA
jgi:Domain of unknown function (DUF1918)